MRQCFKISDTSPVSLAIGSCGGCVVVMTFVVGACSSFFVLLDRIAALAGGTARARALTASLAELRLRDIASPEVCCCEAP